jgi:DNA polymerase III delta' subunit
VTGTFDDIIGHQQVIVQLEREVASPANSYLFVGATGLGKATVAVRFARLLLCPEGGRHPEPCRSCRRVDSGNHPDLVVAEPEGKVSMGVDQARVMIQQATLRPYEGDRKVFVMEEADALTEQAANALLKTLEEPSNTTVFILVVESEESLPATVASRCRSVYFGRIPEEMIVAGLVARGVEPEQAGSVARMSGGRPGLAMTIASNPAVSDFRNEWLSVPNRVTDRPGEAFLLAQEMLAVAEPLIKEVGEDEGGGKEKVDRVTRRARQALLVSGLEMLASFYTDSAAIQLGGPVRNDDIPLADLTKVSSRRAVRNAGLCLDAAADLQANLRPQLLLANLLTRLGSEEEG